MNKTIRVTGTGKISVRPDQVNLIISAKGVYEKYSDALKNCSECRDIIFNSIKEYGFVDTDLRTIDFDVHEKTESYEDRKGRWRRKTVGYEFEHSMRLVFDRDNEMTGNILSAIAKTTVEPELNVGYSVKDVSGVKNELLSIIVEDSRNKAKVLASAAGVELGDIETIDYSWGEIRFETRPMNRNFGSVYDEDDDYEDDAYECIEALSVEPDDIDVKDSVTVVWGIK